MAVATAVLLAEVQKLPDASYWGLDVLDGVRDGRYVHPVDAGSARIYIIDSGIVAGHADFGGRVTSLGHFCLDRAEPTATAASNEIRNDGTPSIDGFGGHGTHVASYAAGSLSGVAKTATVYSLRASGSEGPDCQDNDPTATKRAVDWLISSSGNPRRQRHRPPAIVNISFAFHDPPPANANAHKASLADLSASISLAMDKGYAFTLSGGTGGPVTGHWSSDAASRALVVGGTDSDYRQLAPPESYGPLLSLFAPAKGLRGADAHGGFTIPESYCCGAGDSFAAPFVAGVAAIYLQGHPYFQQHPAEFPAAAKSAISGGAAVGWVIGSGDNGTPNRFAQLTKH